MAYQPWIGLRTNRPCRHDTARNLGILERKSNDRRAVELLTGEMRQLRPDDPAFYDFALFGIGMEGKNNPETTMQ